MANIIIPVEHQSAPRTPARILPSVSLAPSPAASSRPSWETYDNEMDLPEYNDPAIRAQMAEMEKRVLDKSPEQAVEAALREHEKNVNDPRIKGCRWQGQERWQGRENEEMRMVRIYHAHTFIDKLRAAGVVALKEDPLDWYRQAQIPIESWPKPYARIWLNGFTRAGRVGLNAIVAGEAKTVTSLQYPYGPEFSIMRFDAYNLPSNEKYRGWRTALLALITANVITEAEAEKAFGPAYGPAASFYNEQLYKHRAITYGLRLN